MFVEQFRVGSAGRQASRHIRRQAAALEPCVLKGPARARDGMGDAGNGGALREPRTHELFPARSGEIRVESRSFASPGFGMERLGRRAPRHGDTVPSPNERRLGNGWVSSKLDSQFLDFEQERFDILGAGSSGKEVDDTLDGGVGL